MFAVVFPGQGSQKPGMGKELYERRGPAYEAFSAVAEATGVDVAALCFEGDEDTLRQTQNAQLALYTCGVAAWAELRAELESRNLGFPKAMAGHSVGEYAALAAAGVISVEDGARLVRRRGEVMASAGGHRKGAMAAVLGLERDALEKVCRRASDGRVVVIANDNSPGQLVISGDATEVARAGELATEAGAKRVIPLNVSGAFHSPLMEEPAAQMREALASVVFHVQPGQPEVYGNVTAAPVTVAQEWPRLLEDQLRMPVRWTETVQAMSEADITHFVEAGVGEVLCGLIRRTVKDAVTAAVMDPASLEVACEKLADQISGVGA